MRRPREVVRGRRVVRKVAVGNPVNGPALRKVVAVDLVNEPVVHNKAVAVRTLHRSLVPTRLPAAVPVSR